MERFQQLIDRANKVPRDVWEQKTTPFVKAQQRLEQNKEDKKTQDEFEKFLVQAEKKAKAKPQQTEDEKRAWLEGKWAEYLKTINDPEFPDKTDAPNVHRSKDKIDGVWDREGFLYDEDSKTITGGKYNKGVMDKFTFDTFYKMYADWKEKQAKGKTKKTKKRERKEEEEEEEEEFDATTVFETRRATWAALLGEDDAFDAKFTKLEGLLKTENFDKEKAQRLIEKLDKFKLSCSGCKDKTTLYCGKCNMCFLNEATERITALNNKKRGLKAKELVTYNVEVGDKIESLYDKIESKKALKHAELMRLVEAAEERLKDVEAPKKPTPPDYYEKRDKELSKAMKKKKKNSEEEEEEEEVEDDEEDEDDDSEDDPTVFDDDTFKAFFEEILPKLDSIEDRRKFTELFQEGDYDAFTKAVEEFGKISFILVMVDSNGRELGADLIPKKLRDATSIIEAEKKKNKFLKDHPVITADQVIIKEVQ